MRRKPKNDFECHGVFNPKSFAIDSQDLPISFMVQLCYEYGVFDEVQLTTTYTNAEIEKVVEGWAAHLKNKFPEIDDPSTKARLVAEIIEERDARIRMLGFNSPRQSACLVVKPFGQKHFTKKFGDGVFSDRLILPGPDGARVKVTQFYFVDGFEMDNIVYDVDETVFAHSGLIQISVDGEITQELGPGGTYYVPAGTKYSVRAPKGGMLFCVFSQAGPSGPFPSDE